VWAYSTQVFKHIEKLVGARAVFRLFNPAPGTSKYLVIFICIFLIPQAKSRRTFNKIVLAQTIKICFAEATVIVEKLTVGQAVNLLPLSRIAPSGLWQGSLLPTFQ
jgi:hypothetical protein